MKALTFDPASDRWTIRERPMPEPGPGDVLVRVAACGLNPVDAKISQWKRLAPAMTDRWTPGLDVSGRIEAVGSAVTRWAIGDRVLYHGDMFRPHGGLAEYALHDAATLLAHPGVPVTIAAATPCAGWTAWRALHDKLRASAADTLLVAGGAGGVGGFALQMARHAGLRTIIATCSSRNTDYVRRLGATHIIDYQHEPVVARARAITEERGVTLGLDTVGPDNDILVADALGFEGRMVELVAVVRPERYRDAFMKGLTFHQFSLGSGHRNGVAAQEQLVAAGRACNAMLERGQLLVPELKTIGLDEAASALGEMLGQHTRGKIVVAF